MNLFQYLGQNSFDILVKTGEHIQMTLFSIVIAVLVGVPLGILISHVARLKKPVMAFANVVQAVPSIALLGFLVPFLGIGEKPAVCMVVVYSLLPIIKNTVAGLSSINRQTLESARGIGMTRFQVLTRIKLPLALPVIMAGIRISAVTSVGLVTLAAFIGASGLGYLIYSGIRTLNNFKILTGAIPACLLALLVDFAAALVEKAVTPVCFREMPKQ
ncbi:MAG: ABC transporter permease [Spirochaetaceae bacterium]|jgi:osmoprotectant transport system permease protein|nr:ABC transporter permease [Spirochaetaceae bacterium]